MKSCGGEAAQICLLMVSGLDRVALQACDKVGDRESLELDRIVSSNVAV